MELKLSAIKVWEPETTLSLTPEQLLAHGWRSLCHGTRHNPNAVIVEVFPSAQHIGFVHYDVWHIVRQEAWTSKEPVLPSHIGDFLNFSLRPLGYEAATLEWRQSGAVANDRKMQHAEAARTEFVYFIVGGPFVKIGKATGTPSARLPDLQTGCPFPLSLVAHIKGGLAEEFALHKRFGAFRAHGEWFRHEGELAEFVRAVAEGRA